MLSKQKRIKKMWTKNQELSKINLSYILPIQSGWTSLLVTSKWMHNFPLKFASIGELQVGFPTTLLVTKFRVPFGKWKQRGLCSLLYRPSVALWGSRIKCRFLPHFPLQYLLHKMTHTFQNVLQQLTNSVLQSGLYSASDLRKLTALLANLLRFRDWGSDSAIAWPRSIAGATVSLNLLCCNNLSPRSTKGQEYCSRPSVFPKHHIARHTVFAQNIFVKFVKWQGRLISLVFKWGHRGNIKDWGAPGLCLLFVFIEHASKNLKFSCYKNNKKLEKHWLDGLKYPFSLWI